MLTAIAFNCNPDHLGDAAPESFVNAFKNEIRVKPIYRDLSVSVTFEPGESEVTEFASDDFQADVSYEDAFREEFFRCAARAMLEVNASQSGGS